MPNLDEKRDLGLVLDEDPGVLVEVMIAGYIPLEMLHFNGNDGSGPDLDGCADFGTDIHCYPCLQTVEWMEDHCGD